MAPKNLFTTIPSDLPVELTDILLQSPSVRVERIVSQGHASPEGFWYDQDTNEWVLLVQGAARLRLDDEIVEMRAGDHLHIPAHKRHRVEWTDPNEQTIWVAVHYPAS